MYIHCMLVYSMYIVYTIQAYFVVKTYIGLKLKRINRQVFTSLTILKCFRSCYLHYLLVNIFCIYLFVTYQPFLFIYFVFGYILHLILNWSFKNCANMATILQGDYAYRGEVVCFLGRLYSENTTQQMVLDPCYGKIIILFM